MKAIVTGSFDPITLGHMEIIKYACEKYETVYVVALINEAKEYMFTMEQKKRLIELSVKEYKNAVADAYSGMTADYMHQNGITRIVRGYRNEKDLEYENWLAEKMQEIDPTFETEIIKCEEKFSQISSTEVRRLIKKGESFCDFVPKAAVDQIKSYVS